MSLVTYENTNIDLRKVDAVSKSELLAENLITLQLGQEKLQDWGFFVFINGLTMRYIYPNEKDAKAARAKLIKLLSKP